MLIFVDGCSHYATDDILLKWASADGASVSEANPRRAASKSIVIGSGGLQTKVFASSSYVGCGVAVRCSSMAFTIDFCKGSTVQVRLQQAGTGLTIYRGAGAAVLASRDLSGLIASGTWLYIEFGALIHDTVGTAAARVNGISYPDLTVTGADTKPGADSGIDRVTITGSGDQVTDFYLDSERLHGDCIVETIYPTGAGAHDDWTPSAGANYQNVDDPGNVDGDSTYNATLVTDSKDSFAAGNLVSRPTSEIKGVTLTVTARADSAGGRVLKPMLRLSSVDYDHPDDGQVLTGDYAGVQRAWDNNPATGVAWTESAVNGAEIGYHLVASE